MSRPCRPGEVSLWMYTCWFVFLFLFVSTLDFLGLTTAGGMGHPHPSLASETPDERRLRLVQQFLRLGSVGRHVNYPLEPCLLNQTKAMK